MKLLSHKNNIRTRPQALALPNRLVPALGIIAFMLAVLYVALMITTIFFAAWQTQLARGIDESRVAIEKLENWYYDAIARIDATDPSSLGLVAPTHIEYVVAARLPAVSFVGR